MALGVPGHVAPRVSPSWVRSPHSVRAGRPREPSGQEADAAGAGVGGARPRGSRDSVTRLSPLSCFHLRHTPRGTGVDHRSTAGRLILSMWSPTVTWSVSGLGWAPRMASPGRGEPATVQGRRRGWKAQGPRGPVTSVLHRPKPRAESGEVIMINTEHSMNANSLKERKVNREQLGSIKNKQRNSRFYPDISCI